jgi:limonene-1,2-epoxide hydrolase
MDVVQLWHEAVNAHDAALVETTVHADVTVGGPRGGSQGVAVLREWVERSGITLRPVAVERDGDGYLVEQEASWAGGEPVRVATVFEVPGGRIASIVRFDSVEDANAAWQARRRIS